MNTKILKSILFLIVILSLPFSDSHAGLANSATFIAPKLTPSWRTGIISDMAGINGFALADLNGDGANQLASCSNGYAYILSATGNGTYDTTWYSEFINCIRITSGDSDSDGSHELYIATSDGKVLVINSINHQMVGEFSLPSNLAAKIITIADVDDDGSKEIVVLRSDTLLIYNSLTYELEWRADGWGGYEVEIGDIDNDLLTEIVIMGDICRVIDSIQQIQEWSCTRDGEAQVELGDIDGDNQLEMVFFTNQGKFYAMEGETQAIIWENTNASNTSIMEVADVNLDGLSEIILAKDFFQEIIGYKGTDGEEIWNIANPLSGTTSVVVGDIDEDGTNEIIWGSGKLLVSKRALFFGDWVTQTIEWSSIDLDGPLYVAAGDIDNDEKSEIVTASYSTNMNYSGGAIHVYDGSSYAMEWSYVVSEWSYDISHLALSQLDGDQALEILIGGSDSNETRIQSFDGVSKEIEWRSENLGWFKPPALVVKNIDTDDLDEIIVGLNDSRVLVFNGALGELQWESSVLQGSILDIAVGDIDENQIDDIAILTNQNLYVYETGAWTQWHFQPMNNGKQIAIAEADYKNPGELLVLRTAEVGMVLEGMQSNNFSVVWNHYISNVEVKDLSVLDVDQDGVLEYLVMGKDLAVGGEKSFLGIGSRDHQPTWEYEADASLGNIYGVALGDINSDTQPELLLGTNRLVQANEIEVLDIYQTHLPITLRNSCFMPPIFLDDFTNPDSGWPILDTLTTRYYYKFGGYHIDVLPANWIAGARPGIQATDFSVAVDLHNYASSEDDFSGIAFGIAQDWSTFYLFAINWHGAYILYRFDPTSAAILAQGYSHALNTYDLRNHIKVVRNGNMIDTYANNQLLASVSDGTYTGSRYLGLVAITGNEEYYPTNFYNFSVYPPNCSAMNSPIILEDQNQFPTEQDTFGREFFPGR